MAPAAFINPAVIQRTAAMSASERGEGFDPFRYREGVAIGGHAVTLPARYAGALAMSGTQAMIRAMARSRPPFRVRAARTLRSALPSSGFGPSGDRLDDWWWRFRVEARTTRSNQLTAEVEADGHPGYLATARILGEAGLMLAEPGATPDRAGCLTPALAVGTSDLERFRRARMRFSVS
jgi:short subunit dehydrogenase-like uncharacterized protein